MGIQGTERFQDDASFLQAAFLQAQQAQAMAPHMQHYLQHADQFRQWQQQQQAAQLQAQQQQGPRAPEWNPQWENLLRFDAQGNPALVPGADPAILAKYYAFQQYRRDFADRLVRDPQGTLAPVIQQEAQKLFQTQMAEQLRTHQDRMYAEQFIDRNASWLHARDQAGNVQMNPATGRPMLSWAGQRFVAHLDSLQRAGVTDVRQQEYLARQLTEADWRSAQAQQQAAQQLGAQQQQQTLQQGNRQPANPAGHVPGYGGSLQGIQPGGTGFPQNASLSLREQLMQAFAQNGINDQVIQQTV